MKNFLRAFLPSSVLGLYHRAWALGSASWYGNPSRELIVIGVTGTKGKSTTSELIAAMLTAAGYHVAIASTIHFVIEGKEERNLFKMTMPGRGYLQQFLRKALDADCTHAVVEMTSEGAKLHRHEGIELDALVFTNLQPEHLESHGGFENYAAAKLSLAEHLEHSSKRPRIIVANIDDAYGEKFLSVDVEIKAPFSLRDAQPYTADDRSVRFTWQGNLFAVPLPGVFNLYNCLATLALGQALRISTDVMKKALEHPPEIKGRAQRIEKGQPFAVVVDYAHTPDSLRALFEAYKHKRILAVIGSTGGGRDMWNRPVKGEVTDGYAAAAIVTNEDPYDEDPQKIVDAIAEGFKKLKPEIILDRRAAIAEAFKHAHKDDVVLITGKGTDPYIMGPRGTKETWSDARIAEEELAKLGYN